MPHKSAREPEGSMDSRGARGGETEAVDRRGQDYARYAKVTSDGKKAHKRKANVNRCHICEDIVPPVPCLPAQPAWMSAPRLLPKRCVGARERDYIVPRGGRGGGERGAHTRGQEDARRTTQ